MEPIYAKCNKSCGHKFYIQHFKKDRLDHTIEKTYFSCPKCGREYICFYTDERTRKLYAELRELHREMKWIDRNGLERLKKKESTLKQMISNSTAGVRKMIEG
ncbi:hypothetical protein [Lysinibacillus pakistanensis]|uniref:Transglycosylase n=1 Tax=Lysinibacillus pakistanensis TaxID=759811 RepID=A0AAX3WSM7_9BACI|nr:hypothetical protein [Lysinibacillus pakistanensis]MDM5230177.1 hypothetical protein [Lysinibacillus pakistanensis]WHY45771.1 hypothetical protein QNH22_21225 [Lysinibacillus pakistanensis]WHY50781.1 hypothetical protein QNH24_21190 [Lysinibacillus pakistanensis]